MKAVHMCVILTFKLQCTLLVQFINVNINIIRRTKELYYKLMRTFTRRIRRKGMRIFASRRQYATQRRNITTVN
jgi:hypothetical protein